MENNKLGVVLFIATEAFFFTLLILAYLYFLGSQNSGPSAASALSVKTTGIFSLFLFSSSFTVWRAETNLKAERRGKVMAWLLVTILFGITFLVGQGIEWTSLIHGGATVSRNLFGTTFFTLTGFHGLHVIGGLIMLSIILGLFFRSDFKPEKQATSLGAISIYWHFVDLVWVVIFSVVYLGARL